MISKLKGLIVCVVFVMCLGVMLIVLTVGGKDKKDDSSKTDNSSSVSQNEILEKEETPLVDYDKTQVKSIAVENEFGTVTFKQTAVGGEEWLVEELSDLEQNTTLTTAAANIAAGLSYLDLVEENASDLSKYGLSEPTSKFTVSYADIDQTVKTFLIGNESPKSNYYYLCEEGQSTVYTVNGTGLRYYMSKPEYFVDLTLLEEPADTNNWPGIVDLVVNRSEWDYEVKFKTVGEEQSVVSTQIMYEPITMSLNITNSMDVTHGLWGLAGEEAIKAFPTEEDMTEYGLDTPHAVVTLEIDTGDIYTLTIGKAIYYLDESGNETSNVAGYYAYIEGVDGKDVIYSVPVDSLPWATFKPEDVMTTLMTSNYIHDVDTITVKNDSETFDFDLIGEGEKAPTEVTLNGEKVDVELFRSLYQYIITCPTNEIYFEDVENNHYLSIDINLKDGTTDTLEFVKDTDRRTVAFLNGRPQFLIARTWTDLLLENIQAVKDGTEVKEHV